MNAIIIIAVVILIIILINSIIENNEKEKIRKIELEKKINAESIILNKVRELLFEYGRKNKKLGEILYDIEEGGHYHTEYKYEDRVRLNKLINELINKYRNELVSGINYDNILNNMKKEIDKLEDGVDGSFGFDEEDYY